MDPAERPTARETVAMLVGMEVRLRSKLSKQVRCLHLFCVRADPAMLLPACCCAPVCFLLRHVMSLSDVKGWEGGPKLCDVVV